MPKCGPNLWACGYGDCSQNFTVPNGMIVLREYQATSLGVELPATTVTIATVTVTSLGPINASQSLAPSTTTVTITSLEPINASQTSTPSTGTTPTNTASSESSSATCTSSPTSNPEIIEVGVGIGAALPIALVALMVLFYRERKRKNNTRTRSEKGSPMQNGPRPTLAELRGDGTGYELPGGNLLREMGGTNER
jgi:hypothetical protein